MLLHAYLPVCVCVCVSHSSGVGKREASRKTWANSEPDVNNWGGQEGREWLLQYSYVILTWLPATRPCAHCLWSPTDDWGCNVMSSSSSSISSFLSFSHLPTICLLLSFSFAISPLAYFLSFLLPSTSFHLLLICCHLSEEYGRPVGQIPL